MMFSRLYIKLFVLFVVVNVLTQIAIFSIYRVYHLVDFRERMRPYLEGQVELVRDLYSHHEHHQEFVENLAHYYRASIWLYNENALLAASDSKSRPVIEELIKKAQGYTIWEVDPHGLLVRLDMRDGNLLYLHFNMSAPGPIHGAFWLFLIGLSLAFLILSFPVYHHIYQPMRNLQDAAGRIAEGDLHVRVPESARHEVGDVSRAFNRMAERIQALIEDQSELTAHVSHELRSPLTRLRLNLELMESANSKKQARFIAACIREIEDLDRLVGQVLLLARTEIKDLQTQREFLQLDTWLQNSIESNKILTERKSLQIQTDIEICPIENVAVQMLQSALNSLLENAIGHARENSVIKIVLRKQYLVFENISQHTIQLPVEKLLQPFVRGDQNIKQESGAGKTDKSLACNGFGLGLSIASRMLVACGAELEINIQQQIFTATVRFGEWNKVI